MQQQFTHAIGNTAFLECLEIRIRAENMKTIKYEVKKAIKTLQSYSRQLYLIVILKDIHFSRQKFMKKVEGELVCGEWLRMQCTKEKLTNFRISIVF